MHFQLVAYIKNSQFILSRKFGGVQSYGKALQGC